MRPINIRVLRLRSSDWKSSLKLWFSLFFLVCLPPQSSIVKVNKETKEFIRLVIENSNGQVICFSSGPVRAIPRRTRVKNAVAGIHCYIFLMRW